MGSPGVLLALLTVWGSVGGTGGHGGEADPPTVLVGGGCRQEIIINPPAVYGERGAGEGPGAGPAERGRWPAGAAGTYGCDCTGVGDAVTAAFEEPRQQLAVLTQAAYERQRNVTAELGEVRSQLQDLQHQVTRLTDAFISLKENLRGPGNTIQSPDTPKTNYSQDCAEALHRGALQSGVYKIQPRQTAEPFEAYCDMDISGGGWTVFQWRYDGHLDFYRNYANYTRGFGDAGGEVWLGNEKLHSITQLGQSELRVDLTDYADNSMYARYSVFGVGDALSDYRLTVGGYQGSAGDALVAHNEEGFTTQDVDNDKADGNCAQKYQAAWWFRSCYVGGANLNGRYNEMEWLQWRNVEVRTSRMAVRRIV